MVRSRPRVGRGRPSPGHGVRPERAPFLDGVRALAVLAVMAYHSGVPGLATGGYLGVDAFFVLSGLLITHLLLGEASTEGRIGLLRFWAARARRLFPGLVLMLVVVDVYVAAVAHPGQYPGFRGDAFSVLGYVSNWHFISVGSNYFASSASPSLLTHTWSLAIEEQFYVVWPLVVVLLVRRRAPDARGGANAVLRVSILGALASAAVMALRFAAGAAPSALYYGTATHAQCILVGAVLAAGLHRFGHGRLLTEPRHAAPSAMRRARSDLLTLGFAAGIAWMATHLRSDGGFAYEGGFLCFACLVAALLLVLVLAPEARGARFLSARPLVYLGTISYGMYLWYFPLFAIITRSRTGLTGGALLAVRAAAVVSAASASFFLVERPIRVGGLFRAWPARHRSALRPAAWSALAMLGVVALVAADASDVVPGVPQATTMSATSLNASPRAGLRVLVAGDSTALTLGLALITTAAPTQMVVADDATLGCGVAISSQVREHGQVSNAPAPCNTATRSQAQWPANLQRAVRSFRPDVVLITAGRTEVLDRRASPDGTWQNITEPAGARDVVRRLELAIRIGSGAGASVLVTTAPCFASGEQPSGVPWPEDDAARVAAYNRLARAAVRDSGRSALFDLGATVCPDGAFHQSIHGITVRAPDGIHYPFFAVFDPGVAAPDTLAQTRAFGRWITSRLLPALWTVRSASVNGAPRASLTAAGTSAVRAPTSGQARRGAASAR